MHDVWIGAAPSSSSSSSAAASAGAAYGHPSTASATALDSSLSDDAVSQLLFRSATAATTAPLPATLFPGASARVPVVTVTVPAPRCVFTATDLALLTALADVNDDGAVSPGEFTQLWALLASKPLAAGAPAALHCATLLLHKLVRARLAPPLAALELFAAVPSHARVPLLAVLDASPRFSLASRLVPVLDHTGLGFRHLRTDPATGALVPVPLDLTRHAPPTALGAGAAVLDPVRSQRGAHGAAALPKGLPCGPAVVDEVALWAATGTLLKGDVSAASSLTSTGNGAGSGAAAEIVTGGAVTVASGLQSVADKWLSSAPAASLQGDELGVWGAKDPSAAVEVSLLSAVNMPALDTAATALAVGYRVRCCLFDKRMPVSNLHIAKGACNTKKDQSKWLFPDAASAPGGNDNDDWSQMLIKTDRSNTSLIFELTVMANDPRQALAPASLGAPPSGAAAVGGLPGVTELSLGWAQLDISLNDLLDTSDLGARKVTLPLHAGTFLAEEAFPPSALRSAKGNDQRAPALVVQVTPLEKLKAGSRVAELVQTLPVDVVVPTHMCRVLRNFQEALADELAMRSAQRSARLSPIHSPMVQTLLFCAQHQDVSQVLSETWEAARKEISVFKRRDGVSGANPLVKDLFYSTVMRFFPLMSMASNVMPPLLIGANDAQRMAMIRDVVSISTSPVAVLSSDGLQQGWIRGRGMVSLRASDEMGVLAEEEAFALNPGSAQASGVKTFVISSNRMRVHESSTVAAAVAKAEKELLAPGAVMPPKYLLVHRPFSTTEVAFDPTDASMDRLELLSGIHARIKAMTRHITLY